MSTLVLIFPMLLGNPGHTQYINYPTRNACLKYLARQDATLIDKDHSFCKPTPLTDVQSITLSPEFNIAIKAYANKPLNEYHN